MRWIEPDPTVAGGVFVAIEAGALVRTLDLRLESDVSGRDVVLVGGTPTDADVLELYDVACAIAKDGADRLTLVIPYFGYSTMER